MFYDNESYQQRIISSPLDKFAPKKRGERGKEVPMQLKVLVGALAKVSGSPAAAKAFNVPQPSAFSYANGKTTNAPETPQNQELIDGIETALKPIRKSAVEKLQFALDAITKEKLNESKSIRDVASVAANLSKIVEKTAPIQEKTMINGGIQVNIYRPESRDEKEYTVIDV